MKNEHTDGREDEGGYLEAFLNKRIAELDGIRPEDVTVEYIRAQREQLYYPGTRLDVGSEYGGYDTTGLEVLTRDEIDERVQSGLGWLASFLEED